MTSVPQSEVPQSPFLWTRGIAARETLRYLDRNGVDAEPVLLRAELSRGQLSQDSGGISVASQHRFLEFAAIETNDSLLGLHVAAEMDLRDAGILFYLAAASATVAEALEHLARYAGTANEAVHLEISQYKGETVLTAAPNRRARRASTAVFRVYRAGRHSSAEQGDEPRLRPIAHDLCAPSEPGVEGNPSHPAMPGRVRADHRQLGVTSTRHGAADNFWRQPFAAYPGGAC